MYKKTVHFLRGSALAEVQCACPERVLNLLGSRGVVFWGLRWQSEICFRLWLLLPQVETLQEIGAGAGAEVTVLRRRGAPVLWERFRTRYVLLTGFAAFWLLLFGGNLFIWEFRVSGNETVPTETVLRALENYGITIGSPGLHIDQEDMRNHVLLEVGDLSWLTVNVKGCVAHVQVVERQRPPEIAEKDGVWNIVAARDGLVTRVQALDVECRENAAISVDIGKKRIKLWGRGSISGPNCDKITYYHPLTLPGGLRLPITLVRETVTVYAPQQVRRSREQAQKEGETLLVQQLRRQLRDTGRITETKFSAKTEGENLIVLMQAECLEQIGLPMQVQAEESN